MDEAPRPPWGWDRAGSCGASETPAPGWLATWAGNLTQLGARSPQPRKRITVSKSQRLAANKGNSR